MQGVRKAAQTVGRAASRRGYAEAPKGFVLTDNGTGKTYNFPRMVGTIGPDVIDIRKLYGQTGYFTYDPGFTSTGSCESRITYIDGDNGVLLHRGYPIEQLAEKSDYMETCYLLLNGELPTAQQKAAFISEITTHTMLHEQLQTFMQGFRRDAHPMVPCVLFLSCMSLSRLKREQPRSPAPTPTHPRKLSLSLSLCVCVGGGRFAVLGAIL